VHGRVRTCTVERVLRTTVSSPPWPRI
jgi:hypothetical protein